MLLTPVTIEEFEAILMENNLVLVECFRTKLHKLCKFISDVFPQLAEEDPYFTFVRLDCALIGVKPIMEKCGVMSIPTYICWRDGVELDRYRMDVVPSTNYQHLYFLKDGMIDLRGFL